MIFDKVKEVIVETTSCDAEDVTMEANLQEEIGLDSLGAVELHMELEEVFEISIGEEDMMKFVTVGDIVTYIEGSLDK